MNKKPTFIFVLFIFFSIAFLHSQSLFDESKSLYSDNLSLYTEENDVINSELSLFDESKLINTNDNSLFEKSKDTLEDTANGYGIYETAIVSGVESKEIINYENTVVSYCEDIYIGRYGEYLEATSNNPVVRQRFVNYFSDWQQLGMQEDFFEYSKNRAETEKQIEYCYNAAIAKFGIGTGIIATTWIVAYVVPGGTIYQAAILIIAKSTTIGALSGGAIAGVSSLGIGLLQGKSGEELLYTTVNSVADGYVIGSITGLLNGTGKVYKLSKEAATLKEFSGSKTIFDGKVYEDSGKFLGNYSGEVTNVNGRAIINRGLVGSESNYGIPYKYYLADDGKGNFFRVVNPDFTNCKIIDKVYKPPRELWNNTEAAKAWCREAYKKDLADPNVTKILGITKKEATMRLQFENHLDLRDPVFLKTNKLSEKQVTEFLKRYDTGAWHHLPSSGELIYVPKNHNVLAPHTGGDSFWGSKLVSNGLEEIEW